MAYSSGGLIEATDYNNFINGTNQLNKVWSTGSGNAGYGQTAIGTVSAAGTVTATQWASLINTLNSARTHQSGSGSGISAVTAGATINYLSTLATNINACYTNRNVFATQGSTTTGATFSPNFTVANTTAEQTWSFTRTITFASADQARYFFNCGGQLNLVTISATNGDSTGRSGDWVTLLATNLGNITAIRQGSNGGRSGTGGSLITNNTGLGYYSASTTAQDIVYINSTTATYTSDYVRVKLRSNGTQGTHGDTGTILYLDFTVSSGAKAAPAFNESINVTYNHRIDIVYPESTNLTNSWGSVTIS